MSDSDCLPNLYNRSSRALPKYFDVRPSSVPRWVKDDFDLRVEDVEFLHQISLHGGLVDIYVLKNVMAWGHNKTYARLRYLQTANYITRHTKPMFHVAGETAAAIYMLGEKAGRLLAAVHGGNPTDYLHKRIKRNTSLAKADHAVELAHVQNRIQQSAKESGCEIVQWLGDSQLHSMLHRVKSVTIPDGYFVLRLASGRLMYFFVELDRNVVDHVPKWTRKCNGYLGMLQGSFVQRFNPDDERKAFRLLTISHTDKHNSKIAEVCGRVIPLSYQKLFLFTTLPIARAGNVFNSPMWLGLGQKETTTLI